jgi:hypothetical protein
VTISNEFNGYKLSGDLLCCGVLNTGKGHWECEFDLEVEVEGEPEVEKLDQGVYVIAPTYSLEYCSQHF